MSSFYFGMCLTFVHSVIHSFGNVFACSVNKCFMSLHLSNDVFESEPSGDFLISVLNFNFMLSINIKAK